MQDRADERQAVMSAGRAGEVARARGSKLLGSRFRSAGMASGRTKTADDVWSVPANTLLTSAQFDAYRAGNLNVNVHGAAHPNGEIRAQLKP